MKNESFFEKLAKRAACIAGSSSTFMIAVAFIVIWASLGPVFNYSDTWQLVVNTSTTIITFLMVFLIQNTQNKDSLAVQLKLDELIRSHRGAHNALLDLEELKEEELEAMRNKYEELAAEARKLLDKSKKKKV